MNCPGCGLELDVAGGVCRSWCEPQALGELAPGLGAGIAVPDGGARRQASLGRGEAARVGGSRRELDIRFPLARRA